MFLIEVKNLARKEKEQRGKPKQRVILCWVCNRSLEFVTGRGQNIWGNPRPAPVGAGPRSFPGGPLTNATQFPAYCTSTE